MKVGDWVASFVMCYFCVGSTRELCMKGSGFPVLSATSHRPSSVELKGIKKLNTKEPIWNIFQ